MLVGWSALLVIFLCILIFGDFWWFLLRITSVKCVKEVYNLRNPIHCLTLLMPQLSILMPQQIFLFVSFLHHRGQLWPNLWQLWRPFSCRKWLFLEKIVNFGHKKLLNWKRFFCWLCPWTCQFILSCRNNFFSTHLFLEIFFLQASGQFRFYSLSNELC